MDAPCAVGFLRPRDGCMRSLMPVVFWVVPSQVFAFSEPVEAAVYPYGNNGLEDDDNDDDDESGSETVDGPRFPTAPAAFPNTFTLWDRLEVCNSWLVAHGV